MTFKRYHQEAGLTDADYDFLLPLSDPTTAVPAVRQLRRDSKMFCDDTPCTAAVSTPSACCRTFGIAELAEAIFLHLPAETLLCKAQRVCRTWRDFVQGNELIQQYLFLAPIRPAHHPLASQSRFGLERSGSDLICKSGDTLELEGNAYPIIENPWLYLFSAGQYKLPSQSPEPSWKRMLLSQPPYSRVVYGTMKDKIAYMSDDDSFKPFSAFPRVIKKTAVFAKVEPHFVTLGDLHLDSGLFGIKDWSNWRPQLGWETLRLAKHGRRSDEAFVEFELADATDDN